jgi:hypothetical protein
MDILFKLKSGYANTDAGPFKITGKTSTNSEIVIAPNVSKADLVNGVTYSVEANIVGGTVASIGGCTNSVNFTVSNNTPTATPTTTTTNTPTTTTTNTPTTTTTATTTTPTPTPTLEAVTVTRTFTQYDNATDGSREFTYTLSRGLLASEKVTLQYVAEMTANATACSADRTGSGTVSVIIQPDGVAAKQLFRNVAGGDNFSSIESGSFDITTTRKLTGNINVSADFEISVMGSLDTDIKVYDYSTSTYKNVIDGTVVGKTNQGRDIIWQSNNNPWQAGPSLIVSQANCPAGGGEFETMQ